MKGRFVVLEGADSAGKTTQIDLLAEALTAREIPHLVTREPGGSPLAERLRTETLHHQNPPLVELMLFMTARASHIAETIRPALAQGKWVLCDRFIDSTLAYQHFGLGLDRGMVDRLNTLCLEGLTVDLTIFLDLTESEAAVRRPAAPDRIEQRDPAYHQRVRAGFRTLAAEPERTCLLFDASTPPEEICAQTIDHMTRKGFFD